MKTNNFGKKYLFQTEVVAKKKYNPKRQQITKQKKNESVENTSSDIGINTVQMLNNEMHQMISIIIAI